MCTHVRVPRTHGTGGGGPGRAYGEAAGSRGVCGRAGPGLGRGQCGRGCGSMPPAPHTMRWSVQDACHANGGRPVLIHGLALAAGPMAGRGGSATHAPSCLPPLHHPQPSAPGGRRPARDRWRWEGAAQRLPPSAAVASVPWSGHAPPPSCMHTSSPPAHAGGVQASSHWPLPPVCVCVPGARFGGGRTPVTTR